MLTGTRWFQCGKYLQETSFSLYNEKYGFRYPIVKQINKAKYHLVGYPGHSHYPHKMVAFIVPQSKLYMYVCIYMEYADPWKKCQKDHGASQKIIISPFYYTTTSVYIYIHIYIYTVY